MEDLTPDPCMFTRPLLCHLAMEACVAFGAESGFDFVRPRFLFKIPFFNDERFSSADFQEIKVQVHGHCVLPSVITHRFYGFGPVVTTSFPPEIV